MNSISKKSFVLSGFLSFPDWSIPSELVIPVNFRRYEDEVQWMKEKCRGLEGQVESFQGGTGDKGKLEEGAEDAALVHEKMKVLESAMRKIILNPHFKDKPETDNLISRLEQVNRMILQNQAAALSMSQSAGNMPSEREQSCSDFPCRQSHSFSYFPTSQATPSPTSPPHINEEEKVEVELLQPVVEVRLGILLK